MASVGKPQQGRQEQRVESVVAQRGLGGMMARVCMARTGWECSVYHNGACVQFIIGFTICALVESHATQGLAPQTMTS